MWLAAFSSSSVSKKTVSSGADAPLAVDERDLAQARGALVAARRSARRTSAPSSASIRTARPPRNSTSSPRMIDAADDERLRRAHDALDPLRVGRA